jgi:hypothetical protein
MGTVTKINATLQLDDEFADFDVRDELERLLEKRLTEIDFDARPALKTFMESLHSEMESVLRQAEATGRATDRLTTTHPQI